MGALVADAAEMPGVIVGGFRGAEPDIDRDAGGAKLGVPLPGHFRIGVLDRRHHARNAGGDHRIDAGRRFAEMRTGLQRHIERGAARGLAGPSQRLRLGMRPAAWLRPAAADDDAILDDDRADGRVRPGAPQPAAAERQRELHEALVRRFGFFGFLRVLVFQNAEDHLRNVATRASSSRGEFAEHGLKILGLAEIAVDRGEADIGDVVELAQMLHHDLADRLRGNFGLAAAFELAHDRGNHLLDPFRIDRPLAQGDLQRAHQLVAVERHPAAVALDHGQFAQLHPLEGREAEIAGDAHPPPPDHGRILGRTRSPSPAYRDCCSWDSASNEDLY